MYRLIIKANTLRQAATEVEANGLGGLLDRVLRYSQHREWIADLVAQPDSTWVRNRLIEWAARNYDEGAFSEGYGFRDGTLLYWCELDEGSISLQTSARKAVDAMILSGQVQG